jgi:uncharacterized protein (DUF3084 family)
MDKEIAKQKESISLEKEKLAEAEKYYKQDRSDLLSNYAVKLDKDGNITNYEDLINAQVEKLKGMDPTDSNYEDEKDYLDQMKNDFA